MTRYKDTVVYHMHCPDCYQEPYYGSFKNIACGLTIGEHKQVAKARERAEAEVHALVLQERIERQYPRAVIGGVYDEAEVRARSG